MVAGIQLNSDFNFDRTPHTNHAESLKSLRIENIAHNTLTRVHQPSQGKLSSKVITTASVIGSSVSLTRRILQIIPMLGIGPPREVVVAHLGRYSSVQGVVLSSLVTIPKTLGDVSSLKQIGDVEGLHLAGTSFVRSTLSVHGSAIGLLQNVLSFSFSTAAKIALDGLSGIGSLLGLMVPCLKMSRRAQFHWQLDQILKDPSLMQKGRIHKALEFLKDEVVPKAEEKEAVIQEINRLYSAWGPQAKGRKIRKKIEDLAVVKFNGVKRRIGQKAAERLLKELDVHLETLQQSLVSTENLRAAEEFINDIRNQSVKKILSSAITLATSLIAFTGLVIGTFFSLGALPYILYGISTAISWIVFIYPILSKNFKNITLDILNNLTTILAIDVL
ncbi:MAG TPA: hypothetical protein VLE95_03670 [Chlamydiales bacterium]|nr:hypothetical protein [Chlamydiales bacterium]